MSKLFIELMNIESKKMNLDQTNFNNPHGLPDEKNVSCSWDIAKLS